MDVNGAVTAMSRIAELEDGTPQRHAVTLHLNQKLLTDPENFWEVYFDTLDRISGESPTRDLYSHTGNQTKRDAIAALEHVGRLETAVVQ